MLTQASSLQLSTTVNYAVSITLQVGLAGWRARRGGCQGVYKHVEG